jgi:putative ABC transport system permease protein
MLDQSAVRRFGPFRAGDYREINNRRFRIVGSTAEAKSFTTTPIAFLDYRRLQAANRDLYDQRTRFIVVKLNDGVDREAVRREIQQCVPFNDVHTRDEWAKRTRGYWVKNTGLGLNMYLTVFLGCLVGVLVVAQTLYTSTLEHIREFATVKAIGGSNRDIYRIIAEQALFIGTAGFVLGWGVVLGLRPLLATMDLRLALPSTTVSAIYGGAMLLCLVSSLVSYRRVSKVDPAMIFRG